MLTNIKNKLVYYILYLLPKNFLSLLLGKLVELKLPRSFSVMINKFLVKTFTIDLSDAEKSIEQYENFQSLFTRKLKPDARFVTNNKNALISPCDGMISVIGKITDNQILQVKDSYYKLSELLGNKYDKTFLGGDFITIYLSPKDYHRFHSPVEGIIKESSYIPGHLWPVNKWAVNNVDNLFCQNERVITLLSCFNESKNIAMVSVGATLVGKIKLSYTDFLNPHQITDRGIPHPIKHHPIDISLGQELGCFMFGSTVILILEPGILKETFIDCPKAVKMGEILTILE